MRTWPTIAQIAAATKDGKKTAVSNVEQALAIIEKNKQYNAIIATITKNSRAKAKEIDLKIKKQKFDGRLAGVPFIAKDNFLVFGAKTTAASNILKNFDAPYQATAIEKLESEGAICVAKANLDAFAHGASTENSDFFTTLNPHDKTRVPGGSSGGSTTAVFLEMAPFALGTDTGGSIRQPASFCGVVGYKPTYGLVSRNGVVAMASSTDVIGPITTSVEDAGLVLDVMSGRDSLDGTTISKDPVGYQVASLTPQVSRLKIGIVKEYFGEGLSPDVKKIIDKAIDKLKDAGARVEDVSLPSIPLALAVYYIVCPAEVSSNLSRYDGQRYGFSFKNARNLEESYNKSRSLGFGAEAKRRIMLGTYVLSSGYYDAYYKKAQIVRTKLIQEFNDAFKKVDFLIGPVAPSTAFKVGENSEDPLKMYLQDIMTVAANLTGIPAISLPAGDSNGLPVGLQIMADQKKDRQLLEFAKSIEEML